MRAARLGVAAGIIVVLSAPVFAAWPEPPAGASSCSGCHAARKNVDTAIPPVAGRAAVDIIAEMQAFKTGRKPSTVMERIAKGFTDAEVEAIAVWYAQQK